MIKNKIAIAISGGIDSLVAAYILKQQNYEVIGIHFTTGYNNPDDNLVKSVMDNIADQLKINIKIIDCSKPFKKHVIDYFTSTYLKGKTPNPCLVCNPLIKFGTVLKFTHSLDIPFLATGHYANVIIDDKKTCHLIKGIDPKKDQSYFLSFLSQKQLHCAYFPLGNMTKEDVKTFAINNKLSPVSIQESQDICFIKDIDYSEFILSYTSLTPMPGYIIDIKKNIIGKHNGLHKFTIGQRKGINCPGPKPYYVLKIDIKNNILVVGFKDQLLTKKCMVYRINWINDAPSSGIKILIRLRYRHKEVPAMLFPQSNNQALIEFDMPQPSVTPGQGAVFYNDNEVLGAGFIDDKNLG